MTYYNIMEYHQKVVLEKDGNKQHLYYENNNKRMYKELSEDSFNNIFTQFKPNVDFSFPDRLIQHFVKDGTILPTFKSSLHYNDEDLENATHNLNKELKLIHNKLHSKSMKQNRRAQKKSKGPKKTMKKDTKKEKENIKQELKKRLLKAINAKKQVSSKKSQDKNKTKKGKGKGKGKSSK
jgi:hypothetical protein